MLESHFIEFQITFEQVHVMMYVLHPHVFEPVSEECGAFISDLVFYEVQFSDLIRMLIHAL